MITFDELIEMMKTDQCDNDDVNFFIGFTNAEDFKKMLKEFCEALKHNKSITRISIFDKDLVSDHGILIAEALKYNQSITHVELFGNKFGYFGAKAIAGALRINRRIISLNLARNDFGLDAGGSVSEIMQALNLNHTLRVLNLANNDFAYIDIKVIADNLKDNQGLTDLIIGHCEHCPRSGPSELAKALEYNQNLTNLRFSFDTRFDRNKTENDPSIKKIKELLKRNIDIKKNKEEMRLAFLSLFYTKNYHSSSFFLPKPKSNPFTRHVTNMVFVYAGCNAKPYIDENKILKEKIRLSFMSVFFEQNDNEKEKEKINTSHLPKIFKPKNNVFTRSFTQMVFIYAGCNAKPYIKGKSAFEKDQQTQSSQTQSYPTKNNPALLTQFNQEITQMSLSLDNLSQSLNSNTLKQNGNTSQSNNNLQNVQNAHNAQDEEYFNFVENQKQEIQKYHKN